MGSVRSGVSQKGSGVPGGLGPRGERDDLGEGVALGGVARIGGRVGLVEVGEELLGLLEILNHGSSAWLVDPVKCATELLAGGHGVGHAIDDVKAHVDPIAFEEFLADNHLGLVEVGGAGDRGDASGLEHRHPSSGGFGKACGPVLARISSRGVVIGIKPDDGDGPSEEFWEAHLQDRRASPTAGHPGEVDPLAVDAVSVGDGLDGVEVVLEPIGDRALVAVVVDPDGDESELIADGLEDPRDSPVGHGGDPHQDPRGEIGVEVFRQADAVELVVGLSCQTGVVLFDPGADGLCIEYGLRLDIRVGELDACGFRGAMIRQILLYLRLGFGQSHPNAFEAGFGDAPDLVAVGERPDRDSFFIEIEEGIGVVYLAAVQVHCCEAALGAQAGLVNGFAADSPAEGRVASRLYASKHSGEFGEHGHIDERWLDGLLVDGEVAQHRGFALNAEGVCRRAFDGGEPGDGGADAEKNRQERACMDGVGVYSSLHTMVIRAWALLVLDRPLGCLKFGDESRSHRRYRLDRCEIRASLMLTN